MIASMQPRAISSNPSLVGCTCAMSRVVCAKWSAMHYSPLLGVGCTYAMSRVVCAKWSAIHYSPLLGVGCTCAMSRVVCAKWSAIHYSPLRGIGCTDYEVLQVADVIGER